MVVEDKGQSHNTYLSGYFQFLTATIKSEFKKQYNFDLPENILRIHFCNVTQLSSLKQDRKNRIIILSFR